MTIAIVCTALLGLLVFGLGLAVSATRGSTGTNIGYAADPADRLHKVARAHGNATEYAPMFGVLFLLLATREPAAWALWVIVAATLSRYMHAAGMILCRSLEDAHPLRFVGALGTYLTGTLLCVAAFLAA